MEFPRWNPILGWNLAFLIFRGEIVYVEISTRFFLRMESSRWNFLGGVVQEKICLEEIYMLSSELVEFPRWNFLGALLQG